MKGYGREKRGPFGLIILVLLLLVFLPEGNSYARRVNCNPSVYAPATKTCMAFYCHSNGRGEYRPIRWEKRTQRLDCTSCHGFPPQDSRHSRAKPETCGQTCHTQTISNGVTTHFHINGTIEGTYEGVEEDQCLSCHGSPQGPHPAIIPEFQMLSNHLGGPATDYDCMVCHMEDAQEYHQNGQIELKNHLGGSFYTLNQFNQFCLSCHDLGNSLFGPAPFSTGRPIPSIHYELISRNVQNIEGSRFWYSHNHMAPGGYNMEQIMNQSGPNSMFFIDAWNQNHMRLKSVPSEDSEVLVRYKTGMPGGLGGGGMPTISIPTIAPVTSNPMLGVGSPMIIPTPTAALISTPPAAAILPVMGGTVPLAVAPLTPVMGGGGAMLPVTPAPIVAAPSPMMGGGGAAVIPAAVPIVATPAPMMGGGGATIMPLVAATPAPMMGAATIVTGGGMVSPAPMVPGMGATVMLMTGGGNLGMNMIRTGPGNMVMGPSFSPTMGLELMLGMPGMITNPMMGLSYPMMGMPGMMTTPMMGMPGGPMMGGMPNPMMGMPGMMTTPMMGMPGGPMMGGMPNPMMGMPGGPMMGMPGGPMMGMPGGPMMGMPGGPMMGMPNPMMGMPGMMTTPMMGMQNPMMGMPGGPTMGSMQIPGMGGMPVPEMWNMPQGGQMGPTSHTPTNNNKNNTPQNQNQQNTEPTETAVCLACHPYENPDLLNLSVIANNFSGHFSHQNCVDCHASHGSPVPGLMKEGINWNLQNRSCNVQFCHPTYIHNPPLANTGIIYETRPETTCNTYSCHVGSSQSGMYRLRISTPPASTTEYNHHD